MQFFVANVNYVRDKSRFEIESALWPLKSVMECRWLFLHRKRPDESNNKSEFMYALVFSRWLNLTVLLSRRNSTTYTRLYYFHAPFFWGENSAKAKPNMELSCMRWLSRSFSQKQKIRLWLLSRQLSHLFVQHIIISLCCAKVTSVCSRNRKWNMALVCAMQRKDINNWEENRNLAVVESLKVQVRLHLWIN